MRQSRPCLMWGYAPQPVEPRSRRGLAGPSGRARAHSRPQFFRARVEAGSPPPRVRSAQVFAHRSAWSHLGSCHQKCHVFYGGWQVVIVGFAAIVSWVTIGTKGCAVSSATPTEPTWENSAGLEAEHTHDSMQCHPRPNSHTYDLCFLEAILTFALHDPGRMELFPVRVT